MGMFSISGPSSGLYSSVGPATPFYVISITLERKCCNYYSDFKYDYFTYLLDSDYDFMHMIPHYSARAL